MPRLALRQLRGNRLDLRNVPPPLAGDPALLSAAEQSCCYPVTMGVLNDGLATEVDLLREAPAVHFRDPRVGRLFALHPAGLRPPGTPVRGLYCPERHAERTDDELLADLLEWARDELRPCLAAALDGAGANPSRRAAWCLHYSDLTLLELVVEDATEPQVAEEGLPPVAVALLPAQVREIRELTARYLGNACFVQQA
jgi:hypothetical protein